MKSNINNNLYFNQSNTRDGSQIQSDKCDSKKMNGQDDIRRNSTELET